MFHEQMRIENVVVLIRSKDKEQLRLMNVEMNQNGEVHLQDFILELREQISIEPNELTFYFDHQQNLFVFVDSDGLPYIHFSHLIRENKIIIKTQQKMSDEFLANPSIQEKDTKRSRERFIEDAFLLIQQWRYLYREGFVNQDNQLVKINLDQSSQLVGVPRKSLEDYYLSFRNGYQLSFDFRMHRKEKIGVLRSFLKDMSKKKKQIKLQKEKEQKTEKSEKQKQNVVFDEKKFFKTLRSQLIEQSIMVNEEQLFNIVDFERDSSNSDENMVFEN